MSANMSLSAIQNTPNIQKAGETGRQNAAGLVENRVSKPDFNLGSDSVTLSRVPAGTKDLVRGDGTIARPRETEYKEKVQSQKGYAVKEVTEDYEREEQRQGHQENMKKASFIKGVLNQIQTIINGE